MEGETVHDRGPNDVLRTIDRVNGMSDPEAGAAAYRQPVREAYWESRDLGAVALLAAAGYAYCMAAAGAASTVDGAAAYRLRSEAKASFSSRRPHVVVLGLVLGISKKVVTPPFAQARVA